ncbi:hypothetical protein EX895_001991 [Sporisorium graminicola]|uniref:Uncharacterized protein n=1 Tax=Sporisorium graminicola TaxID=280036 RepID=A0A4U7KY14_9BASI|nr:hypothetical protein EX895_001991 [Sporisorium graminicola]TKY89460.1 hypothetical protein EX895_001991 [Sporisorium graminicola]
MSPVQQPDTIPLIDTHLTAVLSGVAVCEILSFIAFDVRLVVAMISKRRMRPMPLAYLVARYSMAIGILTLAWLTIPVFRPRPQNDAQVHWLRAIALPTIFTSTSAVLGYRALILHFDRAKLVSRSIHVLLVAELAGGIAVTTLAVSDPLNPAQRFGSVAVYVSPALLCAPLVIAMLIDAVFTLIVVVPILRGGDRPRKGEVVHMLLSDASFFGVFSMVVKAIAIGLTLRFSAGDTNPYLPVRVECVASTVFACRIFRGQETFLRCQRERKAHPSLRPIELEEIAGKEVADAERCAGSVADRASVDKGVGKPTWTLTDCCLEATATGGLCNGRAADRDRATTGLRW